MQATLIILALKLAASMGAGAALLALVNKIPALNVHTKSDLLNKILNALGNGAEDVVKASLSHADLDALLSALASGTPIGAALAALLPELEAGAEAAIGPALSRALAKLLGDDKAGQSVSNAVLSAAHDLVLAHKAAGAEVQPGQVTVLPSGHLLVVPAGQALPAGAKLVTSLGGMGSVAAP